MTAEAHSRSTVYSQAVVIQRLLVNMGHDIGDQVPWLSRYWKAKSHLEAPGWARDSPFPPVSPIAVWSPETPRQYPK